MRTIRFPSASIKFALALIWLAFVSGPSLAGEDADFVNLVANGPVTGQIEHRVDRGKVTGDILGLACIGPWQTISATLLEKGRPFGVKMQLWMPSGAGEYEMTTTGADKSVRVTLTMQSSGKSLLGLVTSGQLEARKSGDGYAGQFQMKLKLIGKGDGIQTLSGDFGITQASGNCK